VAGEAIVIVDDNELNRDLTRTLLTKEGYNVRTASGSDDLLKMLETFTPRLILMDIELSGMNGLQLTQKLKADPKTRDITIIALTAYPSKSDKQKALAAGCDGFITKPVGTRELSGLLQKYIDKQ
jgi:two-component system cell cycle response regulator DivK